MEETKKTNPRYSGSNRGRGRGRGRAPGKGANSSASATKKEMFLDANPYEIRLALTEDSKLVEYYVERHKDRGYTSNIYKGKVARVLPGMQAAFLDLGLERTAFLHVSDILDRPEYFNNVDEDDDTPPPASLDKKKSSGPTKIQDLIKKNQEIMVQVAKEPIGTKGARVTSYVSLPGRYLVLMPTYDRVGVSRRIGDDR
ncbi:MAG: S1 RNA-binding domain-containing protein, partial [Deltaproteobacteria bacterium]|nr:S1 RNA-binding domain-containing protein [Deltaproteobacteria bacterium]